MQVKLKNVRLAFPNLFKASAFSADQKPDFSATLILPKNHPQIGDLRKAMEAVAAEKWEKKGAEVLRQLVAQDKTCLHDGNTKSSYEGFEDAMFVSARNPAAPLVIDRDRTPLTESSGRPYSGCYVVANVEIWAQDNQYGKRINATLRGVQFYADGDAFSGAAPATEDEFDDLSDTGGIA